MPGTSCFEVARQVRAEQPDVRLLFLSAFSNDVYVENALAVKAYGYLTKHEPPDRILEAVRKVARGELCFSVDILDKIVIDEGGVRLARSNQGVLAMLSPRELDVIKLVAVGRSKKQIARELHISLSTVENHTANMMKKLGIHDRVELARLAIREKLVDL